MFILLKYDNDNIQCSVRFPWPLSSDSEDHAVRDCKRDEENFTTISSPSSPPAFSHSEPPQTSPSPALSSLPTQTFSAPANVIVKPLGSLDNVDLFRPQVQVCFTFELLQSLFCLPLKDAARKTRVSVTTLKRICRKLGVRAWPFRYQEALSSTHPPSPPHLSPAGSSSSIISPSVCIEDVPVSLPPNLPSRSHLQAQAQAQAQAFLPPVDVASVDSELEHLGAFSIPQTLHRRDESALLADADFENFLSQAQKQTMEDPFAAMDQLLPRLSSCEDGFGRLCEVSVTASSASVCAASSFEFPKDEISP